MLSQRQLWLPQDVLQEDNAGMLLGLLSGLEESSAIESIIKAEIAAAPAGDHSRP